jgi:hypothetical protein
MNFISKILNRPANENPFFDPCGLSCGWMLGSYKTKRTRGHLCFLLKGFRLSKHRRNNYKQKN